MRRRRKSSDAGRPGASSGDRSGDRSDEGWHVYILRCADGTLYTGCTSDLPRRLRRHGQRQVKYTRGRLPVELLYQEPAAGQGAALRREIAIKRLRRPQKLALADGCKL